MLLDWGTRYPVAADVSFPREQVCMPTLYDPFDPAGEQLVILSHHRTQGTGTSQNLRFSQSSTSMKAAVVTLALAVVLLATIASVDSLHGDIPENCTYVPPNAGDCKANGEKCTPHKNEECCYGYCEPDFGSGTEGKCNCDEDER